RHGRIEGTRGEREAGATVVTACHFTEVFLRNASGPAACGVRTLDADEHESYLARSKLAASVQRGPAVGKQTQIGQLLLQFCSRGVLQGRSNLVQKQIGEFLPRALEHLAKAVEAERFTQP